MFGTTSVLMLEGFSFQPGISNARRKMFPSDVFFRLETVLKFAFVLK